MGAVVISATSVLVYQHVTVVQVLPPPAVVEPPPAPVVEQAFPPAALEPMELEDAKPAGRFLRMPKTGWEPYESKTGRAAP